MACAALSSNCSAEDDPVLNTMHFRAGVLIASDRLLAGDFKYVAAFPSGEVLE
jgi:hypothetical protein